MTMMMTMMLVMMMTTTMMAMTMTMTKMHASHFLDYVLRSERQMYQATQSLPQKLPLGNARISIRDWCKLSKTVYTEPSKTGSSKACDDDDDDKDACIAFS